MNIEKLEFHCYQMSEFITLLKDCMEMFDKCDNYLYYDEIINDFCEESSLVSQLTVFGDLKYTTLYKVTKDNESHLCKVMSKSSAKLKLALEKEDNRFIRHIVDVKKMSNQEIEDEIIKTESLISGLQNKLNNLKNELK